MMKSVHEELHSHLMPFWFTRVLDTQGGFIGKMAQDGSIDTQASKGLILNTRLLWTYAALYRTTSDPCAATLAQRAYDYLMGHFWDDTYDGTYWELDAQGLVLDNTKKIYGQAFTIYALVEYHLAFNHPQALTSARLIFDRLETFARDPQADGYFEICTETWTVAHDRRLSDKDLAAPKSMNNHLHLLEAYTHLYRAWPDPRVAQALETLLTLFATHIISDDHHLIHFFDAQWQPLSTDYTFGHDIEACWLLGEATDVLQDPDRDESIAVLSLGLAQSVLTEGFNPQRGNLYYAGNKHIVTNDQHVWWPQAECVVGFLYAFQLSGLTPFRDAACSAWDFIQRFLVDRTNGEWFWCVDQQGRPDSQEPKVSAWKGPYHNCRACLEILRRLRPYHGDSLEPRNKLQNAGHTAD